MAAKDPLLARLGEYLRSVREKQGLSQEALAFACGLHRTYVGAVERGEYNITLTSLRRITDALQIELIEAVAGATGSGKRRSKTKHPTFNE